MEHNSKLKRFWLNYREAVRRNFRKEPLDRYSVRADTSGLHVSLDSCRGLRGRTESWHIPWLEICAIVAFKSDNLSYDTIWVSIHTEDASVEKRAAAVFPDTAVGCRPVLESLPRHLSSCESFESWFPHVASPAFAENGRVIFETDAGCPPSGCG